MKRKVIIYLTTLSVGLFGVANLRAQESTTAGEDLKHAAKKTGHAVKKSARKVSNKSAELASKGSSAVVDKIHESKQGPDGQTIYINNKSEYYWVDKKGRRNYVPASQLRAKD
ncbi:MAG: hypothetical protein WKI04_18425 [Ferruginibacter sp.]